MHETRLQVTERKIRNGKRKQAEKIWNEKMKVWNALKEDPKPKDDEIRFLDYTDNVVSFTRHFYHQPVMRSNTIVDWDTTA